MESGTGQGLGRTGEMEQGKVSLLKGVGSASHDICQIFLGPNLPSHTNMDTAEISLARVQVDLPGQQNFPVVTKTPHKIQEAQHVA